jgi:hypothetical protein
MAMLRSSHGMSALDRSRRFGRAPGAFRLGDLALQIDYAAIYCVCLFLTP